jgi:hypothetical protein
MNFSNPSINDVLSQWANEPDLREKARAHNMLYEERLAGLRTAFFEDMARSSSTPEELRRTAIDYYELYVRGGPDIPHCFGDLNAVAGLKRIAPEIKLIRVEDIQEAIDVTGISAAELIAARSKTDRRSRALLDWFLRQWNTRGDIRRNPVSFSARRNQCLDEIDNDNWPDLLRDRLGLTHFDGTRVGPIPVALMEFDAGDIMDQAATAAGIVYPFCIPTALDSGPNPQFFPTPTVPGPAPGPLEFGCPMGLNVIEKEEDLIAEIVHPRLTYKEGHVAKFGYITTGLPDPGFAEMRNAHLWALRIVADRLDYGIEL